MSLTGCVREPRVNAGKSKAMVFERPKEKTTDFAKPCRVIAENTMKSRIRLEEERMEEVTKFKYLGAVICTHGSTEG